MHYVGVDLAWGDRKPTGLAVLDDDGRLLHVSTARTDDEIADALAPYVEGDCLVAIDAPLVVKNATGNRPAEAALNRDFARLRCRRAPVEHGQAGVPGQHPWRPPLRPAQGLDMNPRSGRARRAIEVYPHPATISLFRLGRTLKYKQKPGRSLDELRSELTVLMGLVEGLSAADRRPSTSPAAPGPSWPRPSGRRPARATCGWSRTRSTLSCVPTSRCSPTAARSSPRPTATSSTATSSRRRSPTACVRARGNRATRSPWGTRSAVRCVSTPPGNRCCVRPPRSSLAW